MADTSDLFAPIEDLKVTFPTGATVSISYRREAVTSNIIDPESEDQNALATAICKIVTEWDLTRNGQPVLLEPQVVSGIPLAAQQYLFKAIIRDQDVNPN